MNAYLQLLGVETLAVRLRQQVASATAIAEFLQTIPHVRAVHYSGLALAGDGHAALQSASQNELVCRDFPRGVGGVLSFEVDGGREQVARILDGTHVFAYVPNIGDARSLIVDPARITHREVPPQFRRMSGVGDNLIRLSIGLEDTADLIADLEQAIHGAY